MLLQRRQCFCDSRRIIFGQRLGISAGISDDFVTFIQRLRRGECRTRRQVKTRVGFALQRCQIKQLRRRFTLRFCRFGRLAGLSATFFGYFFRLFFVKYPLRLFLFVLAFAGFRINPPPVISSGGGGKRRMNLPIITGDETFNFAFALNQKRQCRCLYASNSG